MQSAYARSEKERGGDVVGACSGGYGYLDTVDEAPRPERGRQASPPERRQWAPRWRRAKPRRRLVEALVDHARPQTALFRGGFAAGRVMDPIYAHRGTGGSTAGVWREEQRARLTPRGVSNLAISVQTRPRSLRPSRSRSATHRAASSPFSCARYIYARHPPSPSARSPSPSTSNVAQLCAPPHALAPVRARPAPLAAPLPPPRLLPLPPPPPLHPKRAPNPTPPRRLPPPRKTHPPAPREHGKPTGPAPAAVVRRRRVRHARLRLDLPCLINLLRVRELKPELKPAQHTARAPPLALRRLPPPHALALAAAPAARRVRRAPARAAHPLLRIRRPRHAPPRPARAAPAPRADRHPRPPLAGVREQQQ
ncbi:hypothetical protein C2E23DRAFT_110638 [Lenzites betulinus]|nr:hypothetical protein C2E23DRAFT_110638 [Lenzites betulinus]